MNISNTSGHKAGLRVTSILLSLIAVGADMVGAETFQRGGSTATIEQSGGQGTSNSQVIPYEDGQKIITQDGSSTDITIQSSANSPPPYDSMGWTQSGTDRFDRRSIEERFSDMGPDERSADTCSGCSTSSASDAFKRRMFDRMGSHFSP